MLQRRTAPEWHSINNVTRATVEAPFAARGLRIPFAGPERAVLAFVVLLLIISVLGGAQASTLRVGFVHAVHLDGGGEGLPSQLHAWIPGGLSLKSPAAHVPRF